MKLCGEAVDSRRLMLFVVVPLVCVAAAAVLFLPAGLWRIAIMLLLALPLIFLFVDRPEVIFCFLILVLFSNLDVFVHVRVYRYALIFFIASFALALANGRRIVSHHPLFITLVAAFTILVIQSISVARDFDASAIRLAAFFKVLISIAIITQFARNRSELRRFFLVIAGAILLSGLVPFIVQPPSGRGNLSVIWGQGIVRYEGFVFEPNTFAMYQIFLIPILVFFVGAYRRNAIARLGFMLAILASIMVLILSFSRGGFVALACLVVMLIVVERKTKPLFFFGLALIVLSIVLVPGVYWERMRSLFENAHGPQDFAILTRVATMKTAIRLGLENPLLGVGFDNFLYHAPRFVPYALAVHNAYLQIFSELGVIVCAVFGAIVSYNMVIISRLMRRKGDPDAAMLGRALLMQQVAILINAFFIPVAYEMLFWYTLALPSIAEYAYRDESPIRAGERIPSV